MTRKQRQQIYDKYNGRCAYCGCELPERWHADHKEPIRRNPDGSMLHPERDNILNNYNPSCPSCNIVKNSLSIEHFRELIQGFVKSLNRDSTQYKFAKKYELIEETGIEVKFYFETINKEMI